MLKRVARLFTIKTRFEAYLVTYAIAVGAVERGRHYLDLYPGALGWTFALLCTGVVFLAGGKLLDSVRPALAAGVSPMTAPQPWARRRRISGSRPRRPRPCGEGSTAAPRTD
ncbi:hypothetical protein [Sphingomonas mesophila]|uniref:hypothetical protein n=1 Tax=Sphingomonas mesophila TaxID=2303576 RepID=UPI0030845A25